MSLFQGTHGITYEESIDDEEEIDFTSSECLESDVPFEQLAKGEFVLIYSHPEAFIKTKFSRLLRSKMYQDIVGAIVVDEVHMVSEW